MAEQHEERASLVVDVFTDIVCPWCLIGVEHLERARAARDDVELRVRLHPFLLDPTTPEEGRDLVTHLEQKYGADVRRMFSVVEEAGRRVDIGFDFSGRPMGRPSVRAHALVALAEERGVGEGVHRALMERHFVSRENINDPSVLCDVGAAHGISPDAVRAVIDDPHARDQVRARALHASRQGITGVPFFVFDERLAFSGAQPVNVFVEVIDEARQRAG